MHENEIARVVVDTAYQIHCALGPGLLESAYQSVLEFELRRLGVEFVADYAVPLVWRETNLGW